MFDNTETYFIKFSRSVFWTEEAAYILVISFVISSYT